MSNLKEKKSKTPLKDAWKAKLALFDEKNLKTDISLLEVGDYVHVKNKSNIDYFGIVKKNMRKNIVIEAPYGGWGGADYMQISELTLSKQKIQGFIKPKKAEYPELAQKPNKNSFAEILPFLAERSKFFKILQKAN